MLISLLFKILIFFGFFSANISSTVDVLELPNLANDFPLSASKAAVFSEDLNSFLFQKEADKPQPIASISKLMSALVFLEASPDLSDTYKIKADDKVEGGKINLFTGDELSLKDLLYTSLIASDNGATVALAKAVNLSQEEFVSRMNEKAKQMFLLNTRFSDASGLSPENVSTAREVIEILNEALKHEEIKEALSLPVYKYVTTLGREKVIESTGDILLSDNNGDSDKDKENNEAKENKQPQLLGGKTGYIDEAGFCFVAKFEVDGSVFYAVVLDSKSKESRLLETKDLVNFYSKINE